MTTTAGTHTPGAATGARARFDLGRLLRSEDTTTPGLLAMAAAGLLIAVALIHIQDQGGILGDQSPTYLRYGYYLVELSSLLAAVLILRKLTVGWFLGFGATIFPFAGYLLSRSVGIPGDTTDIGNWGYTLGTVSLLVEASFITVASLCVFHRYRAWGRRPTPAQVQVPDSLSVAGLPTR